MSADDCAKDRLETIILGLHEENTVMRARIDLLEAELEQQFADHEQTKASLEGTAYHLRRLNDYGWTRVGMKFDAAIDASRGFLRRHLHRTLLRRHAGIAADTSDSAENERGRKYRRAADDTRHGAKIEFTLRRSVCTVARDTARRTDGHARSALCVGHVMPYPPRAGNEYRVHQMIGWLSAHVRVFTVICPLPNDMPSDAQVEQALATHPDLIVLSHDGLLRHNLADSRVLDRLSDDRPAAPGSHRLSASLSESTIDLIDTFCPDALVRLAGRLLRAIDFDVLLVEYIFMTPLFDLAANATKIIDTIDVFSTKAGKVEAYDVSDGLALQEAEEAFLLQRADILVAIQSDEADELRRLAPNVDVVSIGVDFETLPRTDKVGHPTVLLIGSGNPMNVKGTADFLRTCWPLIRGRVPTARLNIVGSVGSSLSHIPEGVVVSGMIDDLSEAYGEARVVVNPIVAGTGLKIKTVEAISRLRTIVTWPAGADGLSELQRQYCLVAHDHYDFACKTAEVLLDDELAWAPASGAREIAASFSRTEVYRPLAERLGFLETVEA